ncbi:MAG: hypothetical protein IPK81_14085 [Rhodospirillales bacterium]|nr:MAG: hypothetical protein IPK81_14085 [Rhodospirillales bacterium]
MSARPLPRLAAALRRVACLNASEAESCVAAHRAGLAYACEAVDHFGGCVAALRAAISKRRHWRQPAKVRPC